MTDRIITFHWNEGKGQMTVKANEYFPLPSDTMRRFDRLILRICDRKEVEALLSFLKDEALPYWTAQVKKEKSHNNTLKLGQVKANITTVEKVLAKRVF